MSEPTQPHNIPQQTIPQAVPQETMPQETRDETQPQASPETVEHGMAENPTGTLAAPANYKPATGIRSGSHSALGGSSPDIGSMAGRYGILRPLAKGGMGQVSVASDTELDREVALKEIQPRFRLDDATLHRFLLEARVTGRLEHPGVVPVYGLGSYDDGRPYYAMRFITGRSFQDAIDEFHEAESAGMAPEDHALALRQLLGRFVDVCNTIGYAHSKGILHRDIKPANVMLGAYGETLVVDWGLAKDMADGAATPTGGDGPAVAVTPEPSADSFPGATGKYGEYDETKEGFTFMGQTMGTPAYMSPEQAAGKWDVTGVASDVYSLGAMLYSLLSGSPPFSGPSYEVITRVQKGDYKPVKLVKGSVPSPLDAIVRKAMAFDIKDRYPDALALANDVERWMADEPVSCYAEPFLVRATRWAKRHRTGVIAAGVVLATGVLALVIGLIAVQAEQRRTEIAKNDALRSRGKVRDALMTVTDDAVGDLLVGSSKLTAQQSKYLDSLIDKFRGFTSEEPDSPESLLFIASAHYRIARLEARVDRYAKAEEDYEEASRLLSDPQFAGRPDAEKLRGLTALYRGIMEAQQSKFAVAEPRLVEAGKIFTELAAAEPTSENRYYLAQARDRLGVVRIALRRWPEADAAISQSLTLRQQLATEFPQNSEYQFRLAQSLRQKATVDFALGRRDDGLKAATSARAIQQTLVDANPTTALYLAVLADIDSVLAVFHSPPAGASANVDAKDSLALKHARNAVQTWSMLVTLNPGDTKFRKSQAEANINLARQCQFHKLPFEAAASVRLAIKILEELNAKEPNNALTETKLLQALNAETQILRTGTSKSAIEGVLPAADAAVSVADVIVKKYPQDPEVLAYHAEAYINRAVARIKDKTAARADLTAAWPSVLAVPANLLKRYTMAMADWMEAAENYDEIDAIAQQVAALDLPNGQSHYHAACLYGRAAMQVRTATFVPAQELEALALKYLGHAVQQVREAIKAGFKDASLLTGDPDLGLANLTPEFQKLIADLKFAGTKPRDN